MFLHVANIYCTAQQTWVPMLPMYESSLMFYPQPLKGELMFYYLTFSLLYFFYFMSCIATIIACCFQFAASPRKLLACTATILFIFFSGLKPGAIHNSFFI